MEVRSLSLRIGIDVGSTTVKVVVLEVDEKRKRISLSIRDVPKEQR